MKKLQDKVVVITGGSSGIGRATAHMLAERGVKLVLAARGEEGLLAAGRECEERGAQVITVPTDVTDRAAVGQLMRRALEVYGRVDVWINNAAVTSFGKLDQTPEDVFRRVVETDLFGYVNGMYATLPYFKERGRGTIINVASIVAYAPQPYTAAYSASKSAVATLGESLRMELILDGLKDVHVCTVLPATIDTPFFQNAANFAGRKTKALPPVYAPERVAAVITGLILQPKREAMVGPSGRVMAAARRVSPRFFEQSYARMIDRNHLQNVPQGPERGNVFEPQPHTAAIRGGWQQGESDRRRRAGIALVAAAGVIGGGAWLLRRRAG